MAYCVLRFRHKEGRRAAYNPENKKLEWWLSVGTAIGVAAMLAPGLVVWHQFVTVPAGATEVEVMGQQWMWSYRLPGKDGRLGISDARNISSDNPMGCPASAPVRQIWQLEERRISGSS
jgi:cytochrome c oxidase subunit 2